jgi:branched-chain amino acid transport system substrate-binding protein
MKHRYSLYAAATLFAASSIAYAADPIKFGVMAEITGPNAEAGVYQVNGAKMAVEEINKAGGLLGRQLELHIEDNKSTNPGSVLAVSKMVSSGGITALLGSVRSTQIQAVGPTVQKSGLPMVFGGTDYGLTQMKNPWFFRARPDDGYSAKVMGEFGLDTLKRTKWAIVHSTDSFGNGGKNNLTAVLKEKGITPVTVQGFTSNSQDLTPVVLALKQSGADIVATYITNSTDVGILAKQIQQLGLKIDWVGSASLSTDTAMKLGGAALNGSYSITDFFAESSPEAKEYTRKYKEKYKIEPDLYSAWSYDAVNVLAQAIKNANSVKPEDIKKAIHALKGYRGAEGVFNYDEKGDGLHGYNVVKNDNGKIVFVKTIDFATK